MSEHHQERQLSEPVLGRHVIADLWQAQHLTGCNGAGRALRDAAEAAGATVLDVNLHDFGAGGGFTGVALLAESHISIHTWPEHGLAAIDIFMCGGCDPEKALQVLRGYFQPRHEDVQSLKRGRALHPAPTA